MYWRKLFDRENPNEKLEQKILDIRKKNKDFGLYQFQLQDTEKRSIDKKMIDLNYKSIIFFVVIVVLHIIYIFKLMTNPKLTIKKGQN